MIRRSALVPGRPWFAWISPLFILAIVSACDSGFGDHPPVYPVKGTVLVNGKPLTGGVVTYELEGGEAPAAAKADGGGPLRATGRIGTDGTFQLSAYPGAAGVPEGKYKVGISSVPPRTEGNIFDSKDTVKKGNPDVLRGRYSDPKTSGLHDQIHSDQANEPKFDLK